MSKYTKKFKIKLVKEYLSGETGGRIMVAKKYNIPNSTLRNWIYKYKSGGLESFDEKQNKTEFTSEFKLSVIQYRQINNITHKQTAEHFGITDESIIYNWEKSYQKHSLSGLENKIERSEEYMPIQDKNSKHETPIDESEREELLRLREENKLLKMKIIYEKKLQALLLEQEKEARQRQK